MPNIFVTCSGQCPIIKDNPKVLAGIGVFHSGEARIAKGRGFEPTTEVNKDCQHPYFLGPGPGRYNETAANYRFPDCWLKYRRAIERG